jgi:hypothetical protein
MHPFLCLTCLLLGHMGWACAHTSMRLALLPALQDLPSLRAALPCGVTLPPPRSRLQVLLLMEKVAEAQRLATMQMKESEGHDREWPALLGCF